MLLTGLWAKIAVKDLGNNIQPESMDKIQFGHQFGCNGCGGCPENIGDARYVCLGCRSDPNYRRDYVDICPECLANYLKGDEETKTKLNQDGHKESHPLLRILYNVEGYYKF